MKKLILPIFAAVLTAVTYVGCGKKEKNQEPAIDEARTAYKTCLRNTTGSTVASTANSNNPCDTVQPPRGQSIAEYIDGNGRYNTGYGYNNNGYNNAYGNGYDNGYNNSYYNNNNYNSYYNNYNNSYGTDYRRNTMIDRDYFAYLGQFPEDEIRVMVQRWNEIARGYRY